MSAVFGHDHGCVRVLSDLVEREGARWREHVIGGVHEQRGRFDLGDLGVQARVSVVVLARFVAELFAREVDVEITNRMALNIINT